jgi:PKD domain
MLTRLLAALSAAVATAAFALVAAVASSAATAPSASASDYSVVCPPNSVYCYVSVNGSGDPGNGGGNNGGGGGGGGSTQPCHYPIGSHHHDDLPCYHIAYGWWDAQVACYYRLSEPQHPGPPGTQEYTATCWNIDTDDFTIIRQEWFAQPPYGYGGIVNIDYLIVQAINAMRLSPAEIHTSPPPNGKQVVGVPTWLWTRNDANLHAYGTFQADAEVPGLHVHAVAHPAAMRWDTGDGGSVNCAGPGQPWTGDANKVASASDCSHTYTTPGNYPITVNSHWDVDWDLNGGPIRGVVPVDRTATLPAPVQVVEVQAINR